MSYMTVYMCCIFYRIGATLCVCAHSQLGIILTFPKGDICQCVETFSVVTTWGGGCITGLSWVEAKGVAKPPIMPGTAHTAKDHPL
jgi:hypothetical protein